MRYEDCIKYKIFKIYGNFKYMRYLKYKFYIIDKF